MLTIIELCNIKYSISVKPTARGIKKKQSVLLLSCRYPSQPCYSNVNQNKGCICYYKTVSEYLPSNPFQIKMPVPTMPSSECLLRTDSLSSTEPVLSDGSVGSAPSLGLSPGPSAAMDISKHEENQTRDMSMKHQQKAVEVRAHSKILNRSSVRSLVLLAKLPL